MNNIYRNIYCGEVTKEYVGKEVRIAGWVDSIRNLGSLMFMVVRDETGIVQLISNEPDKFKNITKESTITILGTVRKRTDDPLKEQETLSYHLENIHLNFMLYLKPHRYLNNYLWLEALIDISK